jgi:hypothetical protein
MAQLFITEMNRGWSFWTHVGSQAVSQLAVRRDMGEASPLVARRHQKKNFQSSTPKMTIMNTITTISISFNVSTSLDS